MQLDREAVERIKTLARQVERIAHEISTLTYPTEDLLREERGKFDILF